MTIKSLKKNYTIEDLKNNPATKEFLDLCGINIDDNLEDIEISRIALRENKVVERFNERNMRVELGKIISSNYLKQLKPNKVKTENDIITIVRYILKILDYDMKSRQMYNVKQDRLDRRYHIRKKCINA